ncbi:hypothetical protein [Cuspidothrix issatschenkoi]|uniref:Uncharacterized protein n=1 Tax=Cuspidothrix issatschenkoi CHARLIE-1 TaxID=2052836 RepID=A0A2S6CVT3_9CYAN|nr:hypothetical protein [Cuspidothrix issatschenkoi]PPJ63792.1 hypothetical protein CUN59_08345 [Cuspidothrix issatschenkoi CHARLIE-1]
MKIIKRILLALPLFLASVLLIVNPAHASRLQTTPDAQMMVVKSTSVNLDLITPQVNNITHSVIESSGCSCANCVQANFQMLQGKLPLVNI